MAWRIHDQVVRGEIDNRVKGRVTGSIRLTGREEPIRLELTGNAWRDLAGSVLQFVNPSPVSGNLAGFSGLQMGAAGDMTASWKVRIPGVPVRSSRHKEKEAHRGRLGNAVYLEWFSWANGRVVIESFRFELTITESLWVMTEAEEAEQRILNERGMSEFLMNLEKTMWTHQKQLEPVKADFLITPETEPESEQTEREPLCELMDQDQGIPHETEAWAGRQEDGETKEERDAIDQRLRINELKHRADQLAGGNMICGSVPGLAPALEEQFWQNIVDFEEAPVKKVADVLAEDDYSVLPSHELSPGEISNQLCMLIRALAQRGIFLDQTDHLSDPELYDMLVNHLLKEEINVLPPDSGWRCHFSMSEFGHAKGIDGSEVWLRYYASEEIRQQWARNFPDDYLPPHEDPPYHRDWRLPQGW